MNSPRNPERVGSPEIRTALLTGGGDKHYSVGLALALLDSGVAVDFIGSDEVDSPELRAQQRLSFLNLRGDMRQNVGKAAKVRRVLAYYLRLIRYAASSDARIFHILWNNKFEAFDRTLLMLYYKAMGKKIAFHAHNVNAGWRDGNDSLLNRVTLKSQYHLSDHIFVHTERMKRELMASFGVGDAAITVIPHGLNVGVPNTALTPTEAKQRLGIQGRHKTILFYGNIAPYKGLHFLVDAMRRLVTGCPNYRLIIAGRPKADDEEYTGNLRRAIGALPPETVILKLGFASDEETELYFKAADVLALPYTEIFQSGVLFLAYTYGVPVVAADVGSLREDIVEGQTGLLCKPQDPEDLTNKLQAYFQSDMYRELERYRKQIQAYGKSNHSWQVVGEMTRNVYESLLGRSGRLSRW